MKCSQCGYVSSGAKFCPGCGRGLTAASSVRAMADSSHRPTTAEIYANAPAPNQSTKGKSNGLRVVLGVGFLIMAAIMGMNALSGSDSSESGSTVPRTTYVTNDEPAQDFSIQESCAEIRADYMAADPGSDQERWALEAADEVCFGQ